MQIREHCNICGQEFIYVIEVSDLGLKTIIPSLSDGINASLSVLPNEILRQLNEIRIRKNMPLVLVFGKNCFFITSKGKLLNHYSEYAYKINEEEFETIFKRVCNYSVHSAIDNLTKGFVTAEGGNRIGVASTAVIKDNDVSSVKEITSLNIRIANEVKDCARPILNLLYINSFPSIIVASPPGGGKTTFLRDFARLLSGGFNNNYRKVVIVDERNEIAYKGIGGINADIGLNTDVISGFPKSAGIEIAVRTLSPEMLICDEISSIEEASAISNGFLSGVRFAVSVHASTKQEIIQKPIIQKLVSLNEFGYIVLLNDYTNDFEIMEVSELRSEIHRNHSSEFIIDCSRL